MRDQTEKQGKGIWENISADGRSRHGHQ